MIEYIIAAGVSIPGLFDRLSLDPWVIGGIVVCLLLVYLFTKKA